MNRYQVITISEDEGMDEKLEYPTLKEARANAKAYINSGADGACIWDRTSKRVCAVIGAFPANQVHI